MSLSSGGVKALRKIQLIDEVTPGTAPTSGFNIWRGVGDAIEDTRINNIADEMIGIATKTNRFYIPQTSSSLSMASTEATYDQLPIILSAAIDNDTAGTLSGSGEYAYSYTMSSDSINTISTYSIDAGDNQQAYRMLHAFVESFSLSGQAGESVMVSANWLGRGLSKSSFVGTGLVTPTVEEIITQKGTVLIDDAPTTPATSITSTVLAFTLDVDTGWKAKYTIDNNSLDFDFIYFDKEAVNIVLTVTFEHNATGVGFFDDWQAGTEKRVQLKFDGSAIAGGGTIGNNQLSILLNGFFTKFDALSDQDGNSIVTATFEGVYDVENSTDSLAIDITNAKANVPE